MEVSSGEFEAAHSQKYQNLESFLQALWNKAGPVVKSMKIMLELMKTEFKGEVAGLTADSSNVPQTLIDFLIKRQAKIHMTQLPSSTKLPTNSASSMKKAMQEMTRTEIQTGFHHLGHIKFRCV